jgi:hypothetical protein
MGEYLLETVLSDGSSCCAVSFQKIEKNIRAVNDAADL